MAKVTNSSWPAAILNIGAILDSEVGIKNIHIRI